MRRSYLGGALMAGVLGLLPATSQVQAQFPLDIAAGATFANVSSDFDTSSKTGFFAAVGTAFPLGENLALRPYVGYVQKGASFSFGGFDEDDTYSYIEIPVFLSVGVPLSPSVTLGISAGPEIGFLISCNESYSDGTADYDCTQYDDSESLDYGLVGSVGLQFSSFSVGGGYDLGLSDIYSNVDGGFKNRVFYLFAGYGFSLGGM